MGAIIIIAFIGLVISFLITNKYSKNNYDSYSHNHHSEHNNNLESSIPKFKEIVDGAYMEGQIDALKNDIKIKKMDGYWVYYKTPWNATDSNSIFYKIPDIKKVIK